MKHLGKILTIVSVLTLCTPLGLQAQTDSRYDFIDQGLGLRVLSKTDRTVAVSQAFECGDTLVVPPFVTHRDTVYMVRAIGQEAFREYRSVLRHVRLPETIDSLAIGAFFRCEQLTDVHIPDAVSYIGAVAFCYCYRLETVHFPENLAYVGRSAFSDCYSLKSPVVVQRNVQYERCAFAYCVSLTEVTIEDGVREIPQEMFYNWACGTEIENLEFPNGLEQIGSMAFSCWFGLQSLVVPPSCRVLGYGAFSACLGLERVELSQALDSIAIGAFFYCSHLRELVVPENVRYVGQGIVSGCFRLEHLTIKSGHVENLFHTCDINWWITNKPSALHGNWRMDSLRTITFGEKVTEVVPSNDYALRCPRVDVVRCEGRTPPAGGAYIPTAELHVPAGCRDVYAATDEWARYGDRIVEDAADEPQRLSGIVPVQLPARKAPAYDLQGRRAVKGQKGLVVEGRRLVLKK